MAHESRKVHAGEYSESSAKAHFYDSCRASDHTSELRSKDAKLRPREDSHVG